MNNWNSFELGKVASIFNGSTPSTNNEEYWNGDIIWITPKDLSDQNQKYTSKGERTITQKALSNTKLLPEGTILLSSRAPIGLLSIAATKLVTNQGFKNIVVNADILHNEFLYYYLKLKKNELNNLGSGTTFKELSKSTLEKYKIKFPELSTQKSIAKILSDLDAKIELNNRINRELEAMAKTLYDYWFVQFEFPFDFAQGKPNVPGVVAERSRGYKSSGGKMVYNAELKREIPEGWEVKKIGKVLSTKLGGTPSTEIKEYWINGEFHWLNSGEIANFPIITSELKITKKAIENSSTYLLPKGTIAISITRHIRPSILAIDSCANQSVIGILESKELKSSYLYPLIKNEIPRYLSLRTGAQQPHINKQTIDKTNIIIPDKETLKKYYQVSNHFYERIKNNAFQNQHLSELRDWLLPMLMNGQVTIAEAEKAVYKEEEAMCVAAEPEIDYGKSNIELSKRDAFLRKLMLASHIVYELCEESTFGHTKLMKLLYLCEQVGGMALQTNYKKFAAGPFDGKTLTLIDLEYSKNKWFTLDKRSYTVGGKQREATIYIKTEKSLCYKKHFDNYFGQESESIDRLISLFRSEKTQTAEIVATLYFAWEELIAKKTIVSEPVLIKAFYDFHKEKKKFTNEQIMGGYHFMLKQGVHPELK